MKETVSRHRFIDLFMKIRPDNFSYASLNAMYDYFTELEDSIGEEYEMEFDVIAICCDFAEYESLAAINEAYGKDFKNFDDLGDYTQVIKSDDAIIIQEF